MGADADSGTAATAGSGEGDRHVTLHSSWRSVVGGYVGPAVLLVVAAIAVVRGGVGGLTVVIAAVAAVLLAVLLFDFPVATRFDRSGIERRAPLRRHRLDWSAPRQLTRARGRVFSTARFARDPEARLNRGGLVAVVGRRRYLLVDQAESRDEFDQLMALVADVAPDLVDQDLLPPPDAVPTYLYRRRGWRPDHQR